MYPTSLVFGSFLLSIASFTLAPGAVKAQEDNYCFDPSFESVNHYHNTDPKHANMLLPPPEGQFNYWSRWVSWENPLFAEREMPPIYDIVASDEEVCSSDVIHYIIWDSSGGSKPTQSAWCETMDGAAPKAIRGESIEELVKNEGDPSDWGRFRLKDQLLVKYADGVSYEDPKAIMPTRKWNSGYGMPTSTSKTLVLDSGEYVGYTGWFTGTCYGHFLTDQLPNIAYLRSQRPNAKFILMDTPMSRNVIQFLDPRFYDSVIWTQKDQHVKIRGGTLSIYKPDVALPTVMGRNLFRYFWDWMKTTHSYYDPNQAPKVIYYTRHNPVVAGGRQIEVKLEARIIEVIKYKMEQHGRTEELYIYNGNDENGNTLSVEDQFFLFRSATTAIGPHGTGLVNAIWMNPFPETCSQRPQMLEFTPGPWSDVHGGLFNGHYTTLGRGFPVLDYNMITYTAESTRDVVYINLDDLALALDRMWGSSKDSSVREG